MTCQMMMSLGLYVLDAADAAERARVEVHLASCPACRTELTHLRPLPVLLARVPDDMLAAGRPAGPAVPAKTGGRSRRPWRVAVAAASAAAAAAIAGGLWLAPKEAGQHPPTITLAAANPVTHVTAIAALTATSWGTSIQLQLHGLPLNMPCRLIVRSRAGATELSGVWDAWHAGPISVPASAGWLPADIASLQIRTADSTLVTIKASRRPTPTAAVPAPRATR